ncbi:MAG: Suppressor of fused protein [Acidimicrobiales bacterium]|nr:Suppressor of fused protein [Acidimicrobiales bacterium]
MQQMSPYATRRASLLRGEGDLYLYLEDLTGPANVTSSAVWVANYLPAPDGRGEPTEPGTPPRMGAGGTRHPEGCPGLGQGIELIWFEEGDAVAVVDGEGVLAAIPGWAGRSEFYGYSRYARGRSPLAWELTRDANQVLETKVIESREFWKWRGNGAWNEIRSTGLLHLESNLSPQDAAWPLGDAAFPELIATRHRVGEDPVWVTVTTGLSGQRMAGVEQYVDEPDSAARIELAIARTTPDQSGAELLSSLASIPFGRCTWLGEGHTIGGSPGGYPTFGPDKAAILLTANPPSGSRFPTPDLRGLTRRGDPVTYLWVMVIDEETFRMARGRDASTAVDHLAATGASWIQ